MSFSRCIRHSCYTLSGVAILALSGCAITEPEQSTLPARVIMGTGPVNTYPLTPPGTVLAPSHPTGVYPTPVGPLPTPPAPGFVDGPPPFWVPSAPPPPVVELAPPFPGPGWIWLDGYWHWNTRWIWISGRWTQVPAYSPGWIAPRVEVHRGRYWFHPGYWSRPRDPLVMPPATPRRPAPVTAPPPPLTPPPAVAPAPRPVQPPRTHPAPVFMPPPGIVVPPPTPMGTPVLPFPARTPSSTSDDTSRTDSRPLPRTPRERPPRTAEPSRGAGVERATPPPPAHPPTPAQRPREDGPDDGNDARRY